MEKVVLITGATSGMGKETALLLAKQGYQVFAGCRTFEAGKSLEQAALSQGTNLKSILLDVCSSQTITQAVQYITEQVGRIDCLINNAGYGLVSTVEDGSDEEMLNQFDVNVFGVLRMCRAVIPVMRKNGHGVIVNIGSFLGKMGLPLLTHYNASKYAVEGITDSLRYEVAPFGIRVHSVLPGLFGTDFVSKGLATNSETMHEQSAYRNLVSHLVPMVADKINNGPSPLPVAQAVLEVLENDEAPIATPVGEESESFLPLAKEMTSEDFERHVKSVFAI